MVSFGDRFSHVFDLSASFPGVFATIGIRNFYFSRAEENAGHGFVDRAQRTF